MARDQARETPFELDDWRVEPARGILVRDGFETKLEPQLMDLLLVFAASPGRVVSKDEIIAAVWRGRAIGDDTLASAISRLRSALGATKNKRYIETLPKRGYRLTVTSLSDTASAPAAKSRSPADDLVTRGRAAAQVPLPPSLAQARVYFESAIRADPAHAGAHVGLADVLLAQLFASADAPEALVASAKQAALAAIAIDPGLAAAWSVLGFTTLITGRNFAVADEALRKAIAVDPASARARLYRAFALATVGRFVEAEREARLAIAIDANLLSARGLLLQILLMARRYPQVIAEARRALEVSAQSHEAWSAKGWAHHFLAEDKQASDALLEHLKAFGSDAATLARLRSAFARGGFEAFCARGADLFAAQRVLFMPRALDISLLRTFAGQDDAAFDALDLAVERGDPVLLFAPYLPHLDRLRNDRRFVALIERIRPVK